MSVLLIFQQEITAVTAAPDGLGAAPDQLWMQAAVSRVIAVAEGPCDLRAAIAQTGLVIGAFHDVESRLAAAALRKLIAEARIRSEALQGYLHKEARDPLCQSEDPNHALQMGHKSGGKALEVFPEKPDRPLLINAVGAERLIDGDPRIDPRIGVRPERLGIRSFFPAELLEALLRLRRNTLCLFPPDFLRRDGTGGFDQSVHCSLLRFLSDTSAALPAVPGVGLVPNKAEVAESAPLTQGLGSDIPRIWQVPVVDDIYHIIVSII